MVVVEEITEEASPPKESQKQKKAPGKKGTKAETLATIEKMRLAKEAEKAAEKERKERWAADEAQKIQDKLQEVMAAAKEKEKKTEPVKAKTEPVKTEKTDKTQPEPKKMDKTKSEPVKTEPSKAEKKENPDKPKKTEKPAEESVEKAAEKQAKPQKAQSKKEKAAAKAKGKKDAQKKDMPKPEPKKDASEIGAEKENKAQTPEAKPTETKTEVQKEATPATLKSEASPKPKEQKEESKPEVKKEGKSEAAVEAEDPTPRETLQFYPYAYALLEDELDNFCWYCLVNRGEMKRCSACKVAWFCDRECQLLAWADHKAECKGLAKLPQPKKLPSVEVRMLGRLVTRYKAEVTGKSSDIPYFDLHRTSQRKVMDLAHHSDDMRNDPAAWRKFEDLYEELAKFYDEKALMDKETVFQLHCRNYINRHAISDKDYMREVGKGLYLDLCAYDHSCRPNAIYTCDGLVATLRPLDDSVDISDKSKTFYSYIDLISHKPQRRKDLKESWYFDCKCARCEDDGENILTAVTCPKCGADVQLFGSFSRKDLDRVQITCTSCLESLAKEHVMEAVKAMQFIDGVLSRGEINEMTKIKGRAFIDGFLDSVRGRLLPNVNIFVVRLIQQAIFLCEQEEVERLLKFHEDAERAMRVCFPVNHPALAYHLMNIGIWRHRLGKEDSALAYLREAQSMIHYVLGTEHPMARTLVGFLQ